MIANEELILIRVWMLFWIIELRSSFQSWVVLLSVHPRSEYLLVKILLIKVAAEKAFQNPFSTVSLRYLSLNIPACESGAYVIWIDANRCTLICFRFMWRSWLMMIIFLSVVHFILQSVHLCFQNWFYSISGCMKKPWCIASLLWMALLGSLIYETCFDPVK